MRLKFFPIKLDHYKAQRRETDKEQLKELMVAAMETIKGMNGISKALSAMENREESIPEALLEARYQQVLMVAKYLVDITNHHQILVDVNEELNPAWLQDVNNKQPEDIELL